MALVALAFNAVWWATPYSQLPTIFSRPDRSRLADENEERRLEGVLGVVVVVKKATADAPDHRAVPTDQSFKGRRLTAPDEALQQLPIGSFARGLQKGDSVNVLDDFVHLRRHQVQSVADGDGRPLSLYYPQEGGLMRDFLLVCAVELWSTPISPSWRASTVLYKPEARAKDGPKPSLALQACRSLNSSFLFSSGGRRLFSS